MLKFYMGTRVTVMLDDDLAKKVRTIQANMIRETNSSVSFSEVINQCIKKGIR